MAFLIAAACGKKVGYSERAAEILSIVGGAFGWRALARELAGKIPFGGGIIPKGAIAYAGTYVVGKGLEHYHHAGKAYTRAQREEVYQAALERGKAIVAAVRGKL
jgi:oxalate decarboxylase/phosphoglucose isomerase-like protein (cupin superfamily)